DPASGIDDDRLLTTATLYWVTGTAGSSSRLHRENASRGGPPNPCPVPLGAAVFAHDLVRPVRRLVERVYDVVHWTEFDRGGHFPAVEAPDLLTDDIRAFFRLFRGQPRVSMTSSKSMGCWATLLTLTIRAGAVSFGRRRRVSRYPDR